MRPHHCEKVRDEMHHLANAMWWARVDWKENYSTTFHGEALPNITKHCIAKDYHRAEKVRNSAGVARITHAGASFWPRSTQKGFCNASDANEEKKKSKRYRHSQNCTNRFLFTPFHSSAGVFALSVALQRYAQVIATPTYLLCDGKGFASNWVEETWSCSLKSATER